MENKINIAELLKSCPKGMELDCTMYDSVTLLNVNDREDITFPIKVLREDGNYIALTKYGQYTYADFAKCVIFPKGKTTWEGFQRPFKDGDVLVHTQNERFIMSIYKSNEIGIIINTHVIFRDREEGLSVGMQICCYTDSTRLATEEEKKKLFDSLKEHGYKWNAETKTLKKLTPKKFDISTLKAFDKVFVRDNNTQKWTADLFSFYDRRLVYPYSCVGHYTNQCVPFESNKHLLGTTDDCDEYFKNWE